MACLDPTGETYIHSLAYSLISFFPHITFFHSSLFSPPSFFSNTQGRNFYFRSLPSITRLRLPLLTVYLLFFFASLNFAGRLKFCHIVVSSVFLRFSAHCHNTVV